MRRAGRTVWLLRAASAFAACSDPERGPARGPQGRGPTTTLTPRRAPATAAETGAEAEADTVTVAEAVTVAEEVAKPDPLPLMQPLAEGPVVAPEPPAPTLDPPCEAQPLCRGCAPVTLDVTGTECREGDMVELLGPNQGIDDVAAAAGTIGHEVLTSLGSRYARSYLDP